MIHIKILKYGYLKKQQFPKKQNKSRKRITKKFDRPSAYYTDTHQHFNLNTRKKRRENTA